MRDEGMRGINSNPGKKKWEGRPSPNHRKVWSNTRLHSLSLVPRTSLRRLQLCLVAQSLSWSSAELHVSESVLSPVDWGRRWGEILFPPFLLVSQDFRQKQTTPEGNSAVPHCKLGTSAKEVAHHGGPPSLNVLDFFLKKSSNTFHVQNYLLEMLSYKVICQIHIFSAILLLTNWMLCATDKSVIGIICLQNGELPQAIYPHDNSLMK